MPTEQIIIAIVQGLISLAIFFAVLWRNSILKTQIAKSNVLITHMEAYQRMIDIAKVKEFVDIREQTFTDKLNKEKEIFEDYKKTLGDQLISKDDKITKLNEMFFETGSLLIYLMSYNFSKEIREELIKTKLPKSKHAISFINNYFSEQFDTTVEKFNSEWDKKEKAAEKVEKVDFNKIENPKRKRTKW